MPDAVTFLGYEDCAAAARMYDVPWIVDGVWLAIEDLDATAERARAAGARILTEPEDTPHGRQCRIEDPEGHRWMLGERTSR